MRKIAPLFITLLFWGVCFSHSLPASNRPELVGPLLERFIAEAEARGLDVRPRLAELDSILVLKQPTLNGHESDGVFKWNESGAEWVELKEAAFYADASAFAFLLTFHELGHAFGLDDCYTCRYNIMKGQTSDRANYLFRDELLAAVYLDIFFEAIKDPEEYNKNHKHR